MMANVTFNSSLWRLIKVALFLIHGAIGFFYIQYFHTSLSSNEYEHVNGVTRIVIPDAFLYKDIIDVDNIFVSIGLSGVKNTIGPSLLWILADFNWYIVFCMNLVFLLLIVYYMERLAEQYGIRKSSAQYAVIATLLMPVICYYSIGALKELPTTFMLLGFVYYTNTSRFRLATIFVITLFLFRYQLLVVLLLFFFGLQFGKNQLKFTLTLLMALSAIFPILIFADLTSSSTTQLYREEYGVAGSLGGIVEVVRNEIFIVSAAAVIVRVFQSLFEPFISLLGTASFYENGSFSVFTFSHVISLVIMVPYIINFAKRFVASFDKRSPPSLMTQKIYSLLLILLFTVGGFSFIHHRYLVPIFPLLIIASLIPRAKFTEASSSLVRIRSVSV
jgi:hypothetical protein